MPEAQTNVLSHEVTVYSAGLGPGRRPSAAEGPQLLGTSALGSEPRIAVCPRGSDLQQKRWQLRAASQAGQHPEPRVTEFPQESHDGSVTPLYTEGN